MFKSLWVGALLLLGLALSSPLASAYPDFYVSVSPDSLSACPCSTLGSFTGHGKDMELTISNDGDVADTYGLYLELPGEEWSGFIYNTQREITLGPNEERIIEPLWITPGCGVNPGSYTATIRAKSRTSGEERRVGLGLEVLKCHQAGLEIPKSGETCRGMPLEVGMNVTNYGKYKERFSLQASVEWANFSAGAFSLLESGETEPIIMTLRPPEGMTGAESVTVSLKSLDSYATDTETFRLNIEDCYSFEAGLEPARQPVCKGKSAEYVLRISNMGSKRDSYSIYTPSWVSPAFGSVSIGPGEGRDISLKATPVMAGESEFNITVISSMQPRYPELRRTVLGIADARECRGVAVVVSPPSLEICSREGAEYLVTVKNIGTVSDTFKLEATLGTLEQEKLPLNAGESKNLKLFIAPGISPGKKSIKVGAGSDGIYDEDESELLVESCYSAGIGIKPDSASLCPCSSASFEAKLENTGKYPDNYTFSLEVPEGMGKGLEKAIGLMPGKSETIKLEISVPCGMKAGSYQIKARAESKNTGSLQDAEILVKAMEKCYSLELTAGNDSLRTIRGRAAVFAISARNTGDANDSYRLFLQGPEWSYLSTESLSLESGESRTIYLYASPEYGSGLGEYELELGAVSGRSSAGISLKLNVVENMTEPSEPVVQPPENATPSSITPNATANVTANVSMNVSIGGGATGQVIAEGVALSWKVVAVTIIALAIAVILITRFAVLIK